MRNSRKTLPDIEGLPNTAKKSRRNRGEIAEISAISGYPHQKISCSAILLSTSTQSCLALRRPVLLLHSTRGRSFDLLARYSPIFCYELIVPVNFHQHTLVIVQRDPILCSISPYNPVLVAAFCISAFCPSSASDHRG